MCSRELGPFPGAAGAVYRANRRVNLEPSIERRHLCERDNSMAFEPASPNPSQMMRVAPILNEVAHLFQVASQFGSSSTPTVGNLMDLRTRFLDVRRRLLNVNDN